MATQHCRRRPALSRWKLHTGGRAPSAAAQVTTTPFPIHAHLHVLNKDWRTDPQLLLFNAIAERIMLAAGLDIVDIWHMAAPLAELTYDKRCARKRPLLAVLGRPGSGIVTMISTGCKRVCLLPAGSFHVMQKRPLLT